MKHREYHQRALKSKDPRFAQIFESLGYSRRDMQAESPAAKPAAATASAAEPATTPDKEDLAALRTEYESVIGKRPFMGWDAETLRSKIDEHVAAEQDAATGDEADSDEE